MTVCAECGGPVDPDVTHTRHVTEGFDIVCGGTDDWCMCPEVCADCCTDPDCPTRTPQETPVADPAPFSDDDFEWFKEVLAFDGPDVSVGVARRLVATVEQTRRERDAALAALAKTYKAWKQDRPLAALTESDKDAIRRARAVPGAEEDQ